MVDGDDEVVTGAEESTTGPPVQLRGLNDYEPAYANYVSVNWDAYVFHIAFGRLISPLFESEQQSRQAEQEGISADVVSRLLIPPESLRLIVGYLQAQLNRYDEQLRELEQADAESPLDDDDANS